MPKCSVETCGNNQLKKNENPWIKFHLFPKDPNLRDAWLRAIGRKNWQPLNSSVVCCAHFKKEDFVTNKNGSRRLKLGAIPKVDGIYDLNELCARLRVLQWLIARKEQSWTLLGHSKIRHLMPMCRICLSLDRKTFYMGGCALEDMYTTMTGRRVFDEVGRLPPQLCWECAARLTTAANFREKAIQTDKLLHKFLEKNPSIKVRDVIKMCSENPDVKTSFVIDRLSDSIDAKDSMPGIVKKDISFQNIDIVNVPVKNEIEIDTTLDYDNFDSNTVEIDVTNDITSNSDVKTEIDIPCDYSSDVKDFENEEENNESKKKVFVDAKMIKSKKIVTPKKEKITPVVVKKKGIIATPIDETLYTVIPLSEEQEIKDLKNRQFSFKYINSPFKCDVCFKGFPTEDKYERHVLKHSEKMGLHACRICKVRFKTKNSCRMHLARQHKFEISCKQCPFKTRSRTVVMNHTRYHAGNRYLCRHCGNIFEKQTTLLSHLRLKHMSHFVCELCGYTFVSAKGIFIHKRSKHPLFNKDMPMEGPFCQTCDVKFLSEQAYQRHLQLSSKHIKSENDPNLISNDPHIKNRQSGANRRQARRTAIHQSERNALPNKNVTCEQCGEILPSLAEYVRHFRKSHPGMNRTKYSTQGTPYLCELCGKIFRNSTHLRYHTLNHRGKRFQCDLCKKSFTVKANLATHMKKHEGSVRSYDCTVCGKQFAFSFNRNRHMFLHTGLRPFKCEACNKSFVTSGELKAHTDHVHLNKPRPKRVRRRVRKTELTGEY